MSKKREYETWTIKFRAEHSRDDNRPIAVRVRRLLKHALRVCGLRCVEIATATEQADPECEVKP